MCIVCCVCACLYVCVCVHACTCVCANMHVYACARACVHMCVCIRTGVSSHKLGLEFSGNVLIYIDWHMSQLYALHVISMQFLRHHSGL